MSSTAGGPPLKEPVPFFKKIKLVLVRTLFRFFTFHNVLKTADILFQYLPRPIPGGFYCTILFFLF